MIRRAGALRRRWPGMIAAGLVALSIAALIVLAPAVTLPLRERMFDTMIGVRESPPSGRVWVVEVGTTNALGKPWSRKDLAELLTRLAAMQPAVIGLDMVLSQRCDDPDNAALARAMALSPVVTGFLAQAEGGQVPGPRPPIAVMADVPAWDAPGAEAACDMFKTASGGAALLSLAGGRDGRVRAAPAAAFVAGQPFSALAVELVRQAESLSPPILGRTDQAWLRLGDATYLLDGLGQFRFVPTSPQNRSAQTMTAVQLLAFDSIVLPIGTIVLIGSTLPEAGGLRASRVGPLHPSVHLQADIVEHLLAGQPFATAPSASLYEAGAALAGGAIAVGLTMMLPPIGAAMAALLVAVLWAAGAWGAIAFGSLLIDPLLPGIAVIGAAAAALLIEAAAARRAERNLSNRMRQHLPGAVVDRVTDGSAPLRLIGEMREITALFTDIEGFSDITRRIPPRDLVQVLDAYFTGVTQIVAQHGGMVDKIVGDAVHAFFNAPVDQPDHVDQAIRCAGVIRSFAADFQARPDMAALGFGRTRIGVETGQALLGDVGQGGRTDYTAHGDAVNMAARLQEASKTLGITVLIGPRAAGLAKVPLTPVADVELRSFGIVPVSTLPVSTLPAAS